MNIRYSKAFVEQALVKVFNREGRTLTSVADDLGVNIHTLRYWMKNRTGIDRSMPTASPERRPQDWTGEEQLSALIETNGLTGEALQAWCREKGIFVHNLTSWRTAFCAGGKESVPVGREMRSLKDENVKLKRDLVRKDKALAEAAALLILQKKFRALWDDEDK
jgi:transposase-like protein